MVVETTINQRNHDTRAPLDIPSAQTALSSVARPFFRQPL
jgi:hypothetical protein